MGLSRISPARLKPIMVSPCLFWVDKPEKSLFVTCVDPNLLSLGNKAASSSLSFPRRTVFTCRRLPKELAEGPEREFRSRMELGLRVSFCKPGPQPPSNGGPGACPERPVLQTSLSPAGAHCVIHVGLARADAASEGACGNGGAGLRLRGRACAACSSALKKPGRSD